MSPERILDMAHKRHFIWDLYMALADRNDLTEPEGRAMIKDLLPHLADIVDFVIESKGDYRAGQDAEESVKSRQMSDKLRAEFASLRTAKSGRSDSGESGTNRAGDSGDMNAIIRGYAAGNRIKLGS
jgi:hypothetical protein